MWQLEPLHLNYFNDYNHPNRQGHDIIWEAFMDIFNRRFTHEVKDEYRNTYGHQIWQGGDIPRSATLVNLLDPSSDHVMLWDQVIHYIVHISTCLIPMAMKHGKVGTLCERLPPLNSYSPLNKCSR